MWRAYLVFIIFGVAYIAFALVRIIQMKHCTEVVDGRFLDKVTKFKLGNYSTKAKFFYVYDGKEYYGLTDFGIGVKRMGKFSKGCKYTLFVNPEKPHKFAYDTKPTIVSEIIPLIMGVLFILVTVALEIWLKLLLFR